MISGLDSSRLMGLRLAVMALGARRGGQGGLPGPLGLLVALSVRSYHNLDKLSHTVHFCQSFTVYLEISFCLGPEDPAAHLFKLFPLLQQPRMLLR
jgi:hypothetical protein